MTRRREEIAEAVRQRVISGWAFNTLRPGQRLPSARVLAGEFHADPRSVTAALRRLESEGLLVRRPPSRAYYLAPRQATGQIIGPGEAWLVEMLLGGLMRGIAVPDVAEYVRRGVETLRLRAVCLECNRDQEQWLCRELRESFGIEASGVELGRAEEHLSELRRADLLMTTASHAADVRALATRLEKPLVIAMLRRDLAEEIERLLRQGPLYFIGTDPRFADKLQRLYADVPGADNLRTVVLGRDDPATIPPGVPAYVMRTARDQLGGPPRQVRALATLRAFSAETARAILSFMARENLGAAAVRGTGLQEPGSDVAPAVKVS